MKRRLKVEDLFVFESVASPKVSPNGKEAVFIKTKIDEEENKYISNLYHIDLETEIVSQWTYGNDRVTSPEWSVDGKKVAFLSNRDEKNQLYIISATGGEAKKLTDFNKGVSSFLWSPCNEKIWLNAVVKEAKTFIYEEEETAINPEPYRTTKMKYLADGVGLMAQDEYRQIGLLTIETGGVAQFTEGNYQHQLMAISNDGQKIVMAVNRNDNQDRDFKTPLYLVDVTSKKETVIVDTDGNYGGVSFSNDDQFIAYVGADRTYENATQSEVYVYDCAEQTTICITENIDAPVGDLVVADAQQGTSAPSIIWTEGNDFYFRLSTMGDVRLYYGTLDGAIYPASQENEHIYDFDFSKDGTFAVIAVSNSVHPGELYKQTIATGQRVPLTSFNKKFVEEVELVEPEAIVFKGHKDWDVHGWLLKPANFKEGEKYPLIVEIHGGPATMYANTFFHELQVLAAKGYGVLYVNPRGSHGYSQQFVDAVRNDYGGGDYADIMAGLDYVLAENNWIDEDRLGVTGGSYGGFMTNWIVGHTNRFKAAVTQRSISNWISFYGVSDIGYYFSEWQHGADVSNVQRLWDFSPLKYAEHIETPLLILHSEDDLRCPIEQAEQLFITLKSMEKETEFVRFPKADHNLSRTGIPNLRIARLNEITGWFEKYI